jgi:hypothetical protein
MYLFKIKFSIAKGVERILADRQTQKLFNTNQKKGN